MNREENSLRSPPLAFWLALGLAGVTVLLALALACGQFQPGMNSDLLYPQVFAHDLTDPLHPDSGWSFGSATFWFPDYLLFLPLYWIYGASGMNYPLYTVALYLLTGAMMAWSLAETGIPWRKAAVAAFLGLDGVLLCQGIAGHGNWLWLLGIPTDHGGDVPNGFALLALTLGAARVGEWSRGRSLATAALMGLGMASDGLMMVHWIIPLGLALFWQSRRATALRPVLTGFLRWAALGLALAVAQRLLFAFAEVFFFAEFFQHPLLPSLIWKSFSRFVEEFFHEGLFTDNWILWLLGGAAIFAAVDGLRPGGKQEPDAVKRVALMAGVLALLISWAAPFGAVYWINATSIRYLLNWLVLPAWMLALRACANPAPARWLPRLAAVAGLAGMLFAWPRIAVENMFFPDPSGAEALRQFCARHGMREGLADYWHTHLLTVEWGFAGPRLDRIEDGFYPCFWCNNVMDYFPPSENGRGLAQPAPQFVVLDGLDTTPLLGWLGSDRLSVTHVGPYTVAVLTPEQTKRAGELIAKAVEDKLQGRRAQWLESQLAPP